MCSAIHTYTQTGRDIWLCTHVHIRTHTYTTCMQTYTYTNVYVHIHIPLGKDTSGSVISFTKAMWQLLVTTIHSTVKFKYLWYIQYDMNVLFQICVIISLSFMYLLHTYTYVPVIVSSCRSP